MISPPKIDLDAPDWYAYLHRDPPLELELRRERSRALLAGRRVLVTGAGGCIGSALSRWIAQSGVDELVLLDSSEGALYEIQQALPDLKIAPRRIPVLASVCDPVAVTRLFEQHRPEVVFHVAAFKHVPLMERNPFAAIANNAFGTEIVADAAAKYGSEQMLMVSTDKAVAPTSIMGASKRIAELILLAPRRNAIVMKVVRLGNVLGSSGSVVPLFQRQIAQGGPVTVSHPDVRRYFMTLAEAVDTLLAALSSGSPSGLQVPELGKPIRILDLAKFLIGQNEVPIVFTELRSGDKMEESLISSRESYQEVSSRPLRAVNTPTLSPDELSTSLNALRVALQQQDLSSLLQAVQRMVPDYRPSLGLRTDSSLMVNA
ncbi:polysaccharide biosynthesis protein [Edaphobacter paludis]|uniref:Polysaccharide biosynthesis protein n=1 Tax=Edaphobacter paludis TaxID=3035702 RepID=A0AAU7DBZ0_9BACT